MLDETLRGKIVALFEGIEKYYGCRTHITQGLYSRYDDFDPNKTTWNLHEFNLVRSAYRKGGDRLMLEGHQTYYEISAGKLVDFKNPSAHLYEFVEFYGASVYRITRVKFDRD
ncbi:MAG TPA: hypothetical protein PLA69_03700 [Flavobacterium sp.]|nr:hypothetical protein [Flavobacterium sp.]